MPDIMKRLGREVLVVDGAMGTMLQRAGVGSEVCPEQLNVSAPDVVLQIHRNYVLVGADCVTSNSFGGTRTKLAEYGLENAVELFNREAVALARRSGAQHVLADVGPTGLIMEPLGHASFDEVFDVFAEQAHALASEGPDAIIIETMTDIAEARCAVMAARSVTDLPVFATVTFGQGGRMDLSGTDPETAAVVLAAAGAAAVGINCGLGPEQMLPLVERITQATALPVIVQPNAGLPTLADGETVFPGNADEMGAYAARFVDVGASVVGSCCGSTPSFTGAIVDMAKERPVGERSAPDGVALAGPRRTVRIGSGRPVALIGERINPTGKKELAESLREGSMAVVRRYASEQQSAGADLLDVNVGAAGVDAATVLPRAVRAVEGIADLPVVLDTTDPDALERALRAYPGRALVNSVNGSEESLRDVLPLAARYGAAVVVLALDDDGIPETAEGRLAIVDRVRREASAQGLGDGDLVVDTLVMTAATDPNAPEVTLDALKGAKERGLATVLGVSNVSHGLPNRSGLNGAFVTVAAHAGLDAAIANPADNVVKQAVAVSNAARAAGVDLEEHENVWEAWRAALADALAGARAPEPAPSGAVRRPARELLAEAVARGDLDAAPGLVDDVIADGMDAGDVIDDVLTPAIQDLGDAYGRGEVFLPQLMVAAEAMKAAVARAKTHLPDTAATVEGRVAFGTVKGDIHSIGKDICISLLESQGFEVSDLGVDVPADRWVEAARDADVVCLSALMTTTLRNMHEAVRAVSGDTGTPALVGGAVVTAEWAESIGAGYAADAPGCVAAVRQAIGERDVSGR